MTELATLDAPEELRESVSECVLWSQNNAITCGDDFNETGNHLKQIKTAQKTADEFFDPAIKRAHELHKMLVGNKRRITDPLAQAEQLDKQKMLGFQREEENKADDLRRKLQAEADEKARIERQRIDQEAARQRQIEADARAKAEEARRAAEAANAEDRRKLLAQAEAAERKAAAAAVKVEDKVEQAAAVSAPVINVATTAPKVAGVTTIKVWKFEVTDSSLVPRDWLMVDEKKLTAFAKAMKGGVTIPGVRFYAEQALSSRGS